MVEELIGTGKADDVYRQLQQHLDEYPVPFPPTKTGSDIAFLKMLFTPEEAKIASQLKFSFDELEPLDSIYKRVAALGYSKERLEQILDTMWRKGSIAFYLDDNGKKSYGGVQLIVGIFENQINQLTPAFVETFTNYSKDGWFQANAQVGVAQMRVVPVGVSFEHKTPIATFDDIRKIIDNAEGPFSVLNCICRQYSDMLGYQCKNTPRREVCMSWGSMAKMAIYKGIGREVSREEALNVLRENEKEGMILQPSNSQKPDFVCSCCSCCDLGLRIIKQFPTPAMLVVTNYFAQSDPEICTGCGTCVDRCQMAAVTLENEKAIVNKMRCIGCGNCVSTCASEAMTLQQKPDQSLPPATSKEIYDQYLYVRMQEKERALKKLARQAKRKERAEVSEVSNK